MDAECFVEHERSRWGVLSPSYRPRVDVVWVSEDETILMNESGIEHGLLGSCSGIPRHQYRLETINDVSSARDESGTDAKRLAPNPLYRLAVHRERTQRVTTPIIFVAQGSSRRKISQLLQRASHRSLESDSINAILNSTRGIIVLSTPRRQRLLHTSLLTTGQLMCCAIIRNYEICHDIPKSCQAPWTIDLQLLPSAFAPRPKQFQTPSTFLFVLIALTYGVLAMLQHHINQTDQFQRHALFIGIMAGFIIALPSLSGLNEHPTLASPLFFCITSALTNSAAAHWFWRTFISPPRKRLNRMIDRWVQETPGMDIDKCNVKFHEIL